MQITILIIVIAVGIVIYALKKAPDRVYYVKYHEIRQEMLEGFMLKNKAIQFLTNENEELRKEIKELKGVKND